VELSEEKTLVTHAKSEAARFLSYEISTIVENVQRLDEGSPYGNRRNINGRIGLKVPRDILEAKCREYERNEKARHRAELMNNSDYDIVRTYQLEYRGLANYYQLAFNRHTLNRVKYVMQTSLLKTLAAKYKSTVKTMTKKYKAEITVDGKKYSVLQVVLPRKDKEPLIATWGGIPLVRMIALRRKTMFFCRTCHMDVQFGRPMRREPISLEEVKALQKEARKKLLTHA
jgi:hypothetical protein